MHFQIRPRRRCLLRNGFGMGMGAHHGIHVLLCVLACLLWPLARAGATAPFPTDEVTHLLSAERKVYRGNQLLAEDIVQLPDRLAREWSQEGTRIVYELPLVPAADHAPRALWLMRAGAPYQIHVGQQSLMPMLPLQAASANGSGQDTSHFLNGRSPMLFRLPTGAETAQITLVAPSFMPYGLIDARQGPAEPLIVHHLRRYDELSLPVKIGQIQALSVGALALILWAFKRHQKALLFFGAMALSLGVRETLYSASVIPLPPVLFELSNPWLVTQFVAAATALTLTLVDRLTPRWQTFLLAAWGIFQVMFIAVVTWGAGAQIIRLAVVAVGNTALLGIVWLLLRERQTLASWRAWTLLSGYLFLLGGSLHDLGMALGWTSPLNGTLIAWGFSALVLAYGIVTADYVLRQLAQAKVVRAELADKLAAFSAALSQSLQAVALSSQEEARHQERQQVMRDLHDTLGARLITALRGVERHALDQPTLVTLLQSSVSDLQGLSQPDSVENTLGQTLQQWRDEWAGPLAQAGMTLEWHTEPALDQLVAHAKALSVVQALLREGVANALKHSHARRLRLSCQIENRHWLALSLDDDGTGIPADFHPGHTYAGGNHMGLESLRARAHSLGGDLYVGPSTALGGTQLRLMLALGANGLARQTQA
ncbi:ATP-binding protein [Hydrogenophaga sp. 5NK40-0174]|uniref:sensor histidine kinase n=1 Tax=Hydrogenophaga sp. 5NK40-0174 TaxID=3127649 RepID=UPI003106A33D